MIDLAFRAPIERRRRSSRCCDISGSMAEYTRLFLHFLHALGETRRVTTFLFGTRLTNVTRVAARRDPDEALARCSAEVDDWSGGTRIGASLHRFNRDWSRRVLAQGADRAAVHRRAGARRHRGAGARNGAAAPILPAARSGSTRCCASTASRPRRRGCARCCRTSTSSARSTISTSMAELCRALADDGGLARSASLVARDRLSIRLEAVIAVPCKTPGVCGLTMTRTSHPGETTMLMREDDILGAAETGAKKAAASRSRPWSRPGARRPAR